MKTGAISLVSGSSVLGSVQSLFLVGMEMGNAQILNLLKKKWNLGGKGLAFVSSWNWLRWYRMSKSNDKTNFTASKMASCDGCTIKVTTMLKTQQKFQHLWNFCEKICIHITWK